MSIHHVVYQKFQPEQRTIRVDFSVPAASKQEARTIAEREVTRLEGWRYQGCD